ncbi:hypothetical protein B9G55_01725 [Saccharibacillus sp. O16]|nr:hypothetical protein B9G55_01725 [Saccharibacillus sp. O16]
MLGAEERELAMRHAPILLFDEREPFFPVRLGITLFKQDAASPSFMRRPRLQCPPGGLVIEYAIYYDYDIQHLYDLEHLWVYLGSSGEVLDAEASFHGRYLKSLLPDLSNLMDGRAVLYVQPGKHALSPLPEVFPLLPEFASCTLEKAGVAGLDFGDFLQGELETNEAINRRVEYHLRAFGFRPAGTYREWRYADRQELFVSWQELLVEIPLRVRRELVYME